MGRRTLRKVDPQLDLSWHLIRQAELPEMWDPSHSFASPEHPLELEVGSGKGLFLQNAAEQVAGHNFLGIEVVGKYAKFSAARLARRKLTNARMVHGDAKEIFAKQLMPNLLHAVHVYFPDPWWKKRHRKRRVMVPEFIAAIAAALLPDGRLHFWTDVEEYFLETLELMQASGLFSKPLPVPEASPAHDLDYRTHFERKKRQAGLPIYRAEFALAAQPS